MNLAELAKLRIGAAPAPKASAEPPQQQICTALVKASQPLCKTGATSLQTEGDRAVKFMSLPAEYRTLAIQRRDFVREVVRVKTIGKIVNGKYKQLSDMEAVDLAVSSNASRWPNLLNNGKHSGSSLNYANFKRWFAQLGCKNGKIDWDNLYSLRDKYIGNGRPAQVENAESKQFLHLFAGNYEKEDGPSMKEALRLTVVEARNIGIHPENFLSYCQIQYHYENKVEVPSLLAIRNGKDWAENKLMGHITRDWGAVPVGSCWVGDHHIMDFAVRVWDKERNCWKSVRPWLTIWLDARSLYVIGWIIRVDEHPDSRAIEQALLNGIRMNGNQAPEILYTDNGKDYLSAGLCEEFKASDGSKHSIALELGIKHMRALPFRGRSKTAEMFFKQVATGIAKYFKSYLGNSPATRPACAEKEWNNPEGLISENQANEAFAWWLDHMWHAQGAYSSKITNGLPPQQVWDKRESFRPALTDAQLYMSMLKPVGERVVGPGGRVSIDNIAYQSNALWPLITQKVLIKADRANPLHVWAFKFNGELICEVPHVQALPAIGADKDALSAALADQRRLLKHTRELHYERTGTKKLEAPVSRLQIAQGEVPNVEDVPEAPVERERKTKPLDADMAAEIALLEKLKHNNPADKQNASFDDEIRLLEELNKKEADYE